MRCPSGNGFFAGISVHTVRLRLQQSNTVLMQNTLPLPHSVNDSICYDVIQLSRQENIAFAAATAAVCERILKARSHCEAAAAAIKWVA